MNAEKAKQKLHLKSDGGSLGIAKALWAAALDGAMPDPVVHIRHAPIGGTPYYRTHVAAIPSQVGCHFHAHGNIPEGYAHQLRKSGASDLVILFGCPDSHLNDAEDRTLLADAPFG